MAGGKCSTWNNSKTSPWTRWPNLKVNLPLLRIAKSCQMKPHARYDGDQDALEIGQRPSDSSPLLKSPYSFRFCFDSSYRLDPTV